MHFPLPDSAEARQIVRSMCHEAVAWTCNIGRLSLLSMSPLVPTLFPLIASQIRLAQQTTELLAAHRGSVSLAAPLSGKNGGDEGRERGGSGHVRDDGDRRSR